MVFKTILVGECLADVLAYCETREGTVTRPCEVTTAASGVHDGAVVEGVRRLCVVRRVDNLRLHLGNVLISACLAGSGEATNLACRSVVSSVDATPYLDILAVHQVVGEHHRSTKARLCVGEEVHRVVVELVGVVGVEHGDVAISIFGQAVKHLHEVECRTSLGRIAVAATQLVRHVIGVVAVYALRVQIFTGKHHLAVGHVGEDVEEVLVLSVGIVGLPLTLIERVVSLHHLGSVVSLLEEALCQ